MRRSLPNMNQILDNGKNFDGKSSSNFSRADVQKYLPQDLLPQVTILIQDSGYVTIKPRELTRHDWARLNEIAKQMGGIWISNNRFSHWSIPLSRIRE